MKHQYIRDLKIGPLKMDRDKDGCFSVMFEFYPKQVEEATCQLNQNPNPEETHREIGEQLLRLMDGARAAKNPEKFLKTHGFRDFGGDQHQNN